MFGQMRTFIGEEIRKWRLGFYRGVVSGYGSASQVKVSPDWAEGQVRARTIQSPILDVKPKSGTVMAVISQDGVAAFPATLGQLFEEGASEAMQAWVRADLDADPDKIQVGAETLTSLGTADAKSGVATEATMNGSLGPAILDLATPLGTLNGNPAPTGADVVTVLNFYTAALNAILSSAAYSSTVEASE